MAQREHAMADRLVRAAAVVSAYGDELDAAQRTVATLQRSWDGAVPTDPLAAWPESALAGIAGTARRGERRPPARRGRRGPPASGTGRRRGRRGRPGPARGARVGLGGPGLRRTPRSAKRRWPTSTVVSGVVARREAEELAEQVVDDLVAIASGDSERRRAGGRPSRCSQPGSGRCSSPVGASRPGHRRPAGRRPHRVRWRGRLRRCSLCSAPRSRRPRTRSTRAGPTPSPGHAWTRGASGGSPSGRRTSARGGGSPEGARSRPPGCRGC